MVSLPAGYDTLILCCVAAEIRRLTEISRSPKGSRDGLIAVDRSDFNGVLNSVQGYFRGWHQEMSSFAIFASRAPSRICLNNLLPLVECFDDVTSARPANIATGFSIG
jgi:hypothetical protein